MTVVVVVVVVVDGIVTMMIVKLHRLFLKPEPTALLALVCLLVASPIFGPEKTVDFL